MNKLRMLALSALLALSAVTSRADDWINMCFSTGWDPIYESMDGEDQNEIALMDGDGYNSGCAIQHFSWNGVNCHDDDVCQNGGTCTMQSMGKTSTTMGMTIAIPWGQYIPIGAKWANAVLTAAAAAAAATAATVTSIPQTDSVTKYAVGVRQWKEIKNTTAINYPWNWWRITNHFYRVVGSYNQPWTNSFHSFDTALEYENNPKTWMTPEWKNGSYTYYGAVTDHITETEAYVFRMYTPGFRYKTFPNLVIKPYLMRHGTEPKFECTNPDVNDTWLWEVGICLPGSFRTVWLKSRVWDHWWDCNSMVVTHQKSWRRYLPYVF